MLDVDIDKAADNLLRDLRLRINEYWNNNGCRKHWWQLWHDPLSHSDELLIARAEWILAFLVKRRG